MVRLGDHIVMATNLSVLDRIKLTLVGSGAILFGAILLAVPSASADQIPYRAWVAVALVACGCLALLAIVSVRAKGLLIAMAVGALAALEIAGAASFPFPSWQGLALGALAFVTVIYATLCLIDVVRGEDPSRLDR